MIKRSTERPPTLRVRANRFYKKYAGPITLGSLAIAIHQSRHDLVAPIRGVRKASSFVRRAAPVAASAAEFAPSRLQRFLHVAKQYKLGGALIRRALKTKLGQQAVFHYL